MKYHFKVHKEGQGFWAACIELEGCHTQGDTKEELAANMEEALNLYLNEPPDSSLLFPEPVALKGKDVIEVAVIPGIAFAMQLRNLRVKHNMTQKQLADKLGMKNIYSYQRLEKKGNPTLSTILKIKKIFPEFCLEDLC